MIQENHGLLVIVSQGQSRSPEKRSLEDAIANLAANLPNTRSLIVPHLYDLGEDSQSLQRIRDWSGPIVILTWLFDRAAYWVLDRMKIQGTSGTVDLVNPAAQMDSDDDDDAEQEDERHSDRVANIYNRPDRRIYSIDLRASDDLSSYRSELNRILEAEELLDTATDDPPREKLSLERFLNPTNSTSLALNTLGELSNSSTPATPQHDSPLGIVPMRIEEHPSRRWYPVIDYSRCTNCMECIDFCLFGVYGVDHGETILVEQPDNCRKGCPACSRVCPENAIIFPQHKSPAIAGAPVEGGGAFKIDLSKLFGAPENSEDAAAAALRERDEQLILAGREAVGATDTTAKHTATANQAPPKNPASSGQAGMPKDQLDSLIDALDSLDL